MYGVSLPPEPGSLYDSIKNNIELEQSKYVDITDKEQLFNCFENIDSPDIILHLAAQPLVSKSYYEPLETWKVNVIGSLNLFELIRCRSWGSPIIVVTTDKVYRNLEKPIAYREDDHLGWIRSIQCEQSSLEIAVKSWRNSFSRSSAGNGKLIGPIATVRSGNVIGGGDYAQNRIIPDLVRATVNSEELAIRNPNSTRPWIHVLDPLRGYILLAEKMLLKCSGKCNEEIPLDCYNFGPDTNANHTVRDLIIAASNYFPTNYSIEDNLKLPHESNLLQLSAAKAAHFLKWKPTWGFQESVDQTMKWYKEVHFNEVSSYLASCKTIEEYQKS